MLSDIIIREENNTDYKDIFTVNNLAFGQDNEAMLVNLLRNNNEVFIKSLSLVASINNKLVGHILLTKIKIIDNTGNINNSLALAPLSVIPELQHKGIGSKLILKGLLVAKELGFNSVIVLGHHDFYKKFGFVPANKWHITAPFDVPLDCFMAIELIDGALDYVSGQVQYPKEFELV